MRRRRRRQLGQKAVEPSADGSCDAKEGASLASEKAGDAPSFASRTGHGNPGSGKLGSPACGGTGADVP